MLRISTFFAIIFVTALIAAPLALGGSGVMGPNLTKHVAGARPDERIPVIIVMKDRPDLALLERAGKGLTRPEKRNVVLGLLKEHAAASQAGIRGVLTKMADTGLAFRLKYLWINNTVSGWLAPAAVSEIAARNDIESIRLNIPRKVFGGKAGSPTSPPNDSRGTSARAIAWGVTWIGADQAWSVAGVIGTGVTVAVIDTGSDYNHSDLNNNIWVNPGEDINSNGVVWDPSDINGVDDDGNGYVDDLIGYDFGYADNNPMDDNGHGTHTAGTTGGDGTGGTQTGVAPGCNLMICKVGYYVSYSDEATVWEGMEYAADNGADVITMSLGWYHSWAPHRVTWRQTCQYVKAAGTTLVIAAGNERGYNYPPNCIRTPGDCPEVIGVGATGYMNNNYAYFSSNGPTVWDEGPFHDYPYPPGLVKPDIAAPGENVNSTTWGGGYSGDTWDGTSMATPHVAGVCALMLEANPAFTPDEIQLFMESTALDLGAAGKDNDYGSGLVQALDAVLPPSLSASAYTIVLSSGSVIDFAIDAGPSYANREYALVGTLSGTDPGTILPGGMVLPINLDSYTSYIIAHFNNSMFQNFRDYLDGSGASTATLNVPGPANPVYAGQTLSLAFTLPGGYDFVSNPISLEIIP